jgi:two-component system NtrC family response regulator
VPYDAAGWSLIDQPCAGEMLMSDRAPSERVADSAGEPAGCIQRLIRGESAAMLDLRGQIDKIAPRAVTVLIDGETGVGKEMAARELHARSRRSDKPFVPVDCTAFSSQLIESQLFGHVRGAFTGAVGAALGFIRCADGGTLFLDEIGELPPGVQAKLLRSLQERAVVPVGGVEPVAVDMRVVAATHRDLARMVREGSFRQDLYFRLNVVRLTIPPLRDRRDDIVPLACYFLEELADIYEEPRKVLGAHAQEILVRYDWPGNVRELRNAIERAFLFCSERTIEPAHLPSELTLAGKVDAASGEENGQRIPSLVEAEGMLISRVLRFPAETNPKRRGCSRSSATACGA